MVLLHRLVSMMCFNCKAVPTHDTNHTQLPDTKVVETNHMGSVSCHACIKPLVFNSLGADTHDNFKKRDVLVCT